jgi:phosphatidylglycerophosphate synthase
MTQPLPGSLGAELFLVGIIGVFLIPFAVYAGGAALGLVVLPPPKGGRRLLGPLLIGYYYWLVTPAVRALGWLGVTPNQITVTSLVVSLAAGGAIAVGRFALAAVLVIVGGTLDILDGQVARSRGLATPGGAFLDSVLDRLSDSAIFGGCAIYYRGTWVMWLALVALTMSLAVSYSRARGEALGVTGVGGVMQRADRIAVLGIALALAPAFARAYEPQPQQPLYAIVVVALMLIAALNTATFVTRTVWTMRKLAELTPLPLAPRGAAAGAPQVRRAPVLTLVRVAATRDRPAA